MTKILKGTEDYKKAQVIARKLEMQASAKRWENSLNSERWERMVEKMSRFCLAVMKAAEGTFAAEVAKTVEDNINPHGNFLGRCSSKQAWIIACAAVEHGVEW